MKRSILTLLALAPLIVFSQTATDVLKAKSAAKAYLLKRLNNPASYQSKEWGKLTKTYSTFSDSKVFKVLNDSLEYYREAKNKVGNLAHFRKLENILNYEKDSVYLNYISLEKQIDSAFKSIESNIQTKEASFKGVFDGYIIDHSFRARNKFNALVINNYYFVFNKLMKVISARDSDAMEEERERLQAEIDALTKH